MSAFQSKLVFVGSMGAGKTTAIRAISDAEPISTEMPLSHESDITDEKSSTTVALDYSTVELGEGELLHLYGVPGQRHLDFMWPIVCTGAMGIIVLVDALNSESLTTATGLLQEFSVLAPDASFVIGVTRSDLVPGFHMGSFRDNLRREGFNLPVLQLDARVPAQVEFLTKALLSYRYMGSQMGARAN